MYLNRAADLPVRNAIKSLKAIYWSKLQTAWKQPWPFVLTLACYASAMTLCHCSFLSWSFTLSDFGFHVVSYVSLCLSPSTIISFLFLFQPWQHLFIFSSVSPAHAINKPQLCTFSVVLTFFIQNLIFSANDLSHFKDCLLGRIFELDIMNIVGLGHMAHFFS